MFDNTIDHVFSTLCCTCTHDSNVRPWIERDHSHEHILLVNRNTHVFLFSFHTLTIVYDFGSIVQWQHVNTHV
jgi:hypothetical protein